VVWSAAQSRYLNCSLFLPSWFIIAERKRLCRERQLLETWIYFSHGKRWNPATVRALLRSPCSRISQRNL